MEKRAAFAEMRQRVLADTVANLETPGYQMKDLPEGEFASRLTEALERREGIGARTFRFGRTRHLQEVDGSLRGQPGRAGQSSLRHDGNDVSVEWLQKEMASNAMMAEHAQHLLKFQFDQFEAAVRGRP
ncbi:MAG: hypothetical protein HY608_02225 [Planctomycetes bacterium]|nr:hypothetical protein [Planctomycetota bacterium]